MSGHRAVAYVNLAAIERNCRRLAEELDGGARLCAVVKADGYGHGAVQVAWAAIAGGASWLAVATAEEAAGLRAAGIAEVPVLVMGALTDAQRALALRVGAEVVVWRERDVEMISRAGGGRVHVKLDTGMGRLGTRDIEEATRVVGAAQQSEGVALGGVMTHFATADDRGDGGYFDGQLREFGDWVREIKRSCPGLIAHAANSAGVLRSKACHFDMVRCGVAVYGMDPFGTEPAAIGLEPALELRSYVAEVKVCKVGQSVGYGRRFTARADTWVAVLPIGYGDGWRRAVSEGGGEVIVAGARHPIVGAVSMDNITVDLGRRAAQEAIRGEEAVLLGARAGERITAEEVARWLGTINYEVTCGLTGRVERAYHRDGQDVGERLESARALAGGEE